MRSNGPPVAKVGKYFLPQVIKMKMKGGEIMQPYDVYIGRRMNRGAGNWTLPDSEMKNEFILKKYPIDESLRLYEDHLMSLIKENPKYWMNLFYRMITFERPVVLGCWCKGDDKGNWVDNKCHGDVIIMMCRFLSQFLVEQQGQSIG